MSIALENRIAAAKALWEEKREIRIAAVSHLKKVTGIPLKKAGGGKAAKKSAKDNADKACEAESEASENLKKLEEMLLEEMAREKTVVETSNGKTVSTNVGDAKDLTATTTKVAPRKDTIEMTTIEAAQGAAIAATQIDAVRTAGIVSIEEIAIEPAAIAVSDGTGTETTSTNEVNKIAADGTAVVLSTGEIGVEGAAVTATDGTGMKAANTNDGTRTEAEVTNEVTRTDAAVKDTSAPSEIGNVDNKDKAKALEAMKMKRQKLVEKRYLRNDLGLVISRINNVPANGSTEESKDLKTERDRIERELANLEDGDSEKATESESVGTKRKAARGKKVEKDDKARKGDDDSDDDAKDGDLSDEALATLAGIGQLAIIEFLEKGTTLPYKIRRLARDVQGFLPQAATTSRELALHIFDTNRGNLICLYHQKHRGFKLYDGAAGKYQLIGVPYPKFLTSKGKTGKQPPEGYLHCGCRADIALLDFFWWKTWTLESSVGGVHVYEGLGDEVLSPRARAFYVKAFTEATGLTIDDMYSMDYGSFNYRKALRLRQVGRLLAKVNEMNAFDGSPSLVLTISKDSASDGGNGNEEMEVD